MTHDEIIHKSIQDVIDAFQKVAEHPDLPAEHASAFIEHTDVLKEHLERYADLIANPPPAEKH